MVREAIAEIPKPKDGIDGQRGEKGEQGIAGPQGIPGESIRGLQGENGVDGLAGPQGERGIDGPIGPAGPTGERGERGEKGIDGVNGRDGQSIHADTVKLMVQEAVKESVAEAVQKAVAAIPKAVDGKDGRDGKDADVIVRGMVDGFELMFSPEDPRVLIARSVLPGGIVKEATTRIPLVIYLGIFKASEEYQQGDMVTHDGSVWHCNAEKTSSIPGKSEDWQLAVKSVRGKDGKDGRPGDIGPEGKAGRDLRYQ